MSLNFRLTAIKNWETLCRLPDPQNPGETVLNPITQNIVFATMSAGIGEITQKNFIEFFLRVSAADALQQRFRGAESIKLEDIEAHIGLVTNVSDEARTKWFKRHFENAERDINWSRREAARRAEAA